MSAAPALARLWAMIRLDFTLAVRHRLLHVVLIAATLFGTIVGVFLPAELSVGGSTSLLEGIPTDLDPLHTLTVLDPHAMRPPFNLAFIPVLLALDVGILGFMLGSVMVLQDKQSGAIHVYRTTPGTTAIYVASKLVVNLGLAMLNTLILVALGGASLLTHLELYPLMLLASTGFTLLGIGLAVYFRSISSFFYPMAIVGSLGAMPLWLHLTPSASLAWTWWLPNYHVMFGAEAVFFTGDGQIVSTAMLFLLVFSALSATLAGFGVHGRLMREEG